jgi:hypothetical protein
MASIYTVSLQDAKSKLRWHFHNMIIWQVICTEDSQMRFKNKIIKTTLITFCFALIVSCSHRKVIGEHIGIHYNYYSNLRPTPPSTTKENPFTTDSAGFMEWKDQMTANCIIALEDRVKERIKCDCRYQLV